MKKIFDLLKKINVCILIFIFTFFLSKINIVLADKEERVIPIAMATDNNYVYPTLVSVTSILENKNKDTKVNFHIMLSGKVTGENKEKFKKLIKHYPDCSIDLIDMGDRFSSARTLGHITTPTYYRLSLPSLLPEYDKILYIDGDTVITKDLWEMFNTDIEDYYVVGVPDLGVGALSEEDKKDYAKRLGIYDMEQYINAGVLLMNTKMMRKDNLEEKFNGYIPTLVERRVSYADQEVINAVCYGKIKLLNPMYNAQLWCDFSDMPTILHWVGGNKPWKNKNVRFYSEWKRYRYIAEKNIYGEPVLKDGWYTIFSALNKSRVLDISNSSQQNGGNLQLWEDNGTNAQKFWVRYVGEGYYEIESLCSGKVLDVEHSGKTKGTNVWQYERNGTDAQKWLIKKADDDDSDCYYIISKCNGLSLDVEYSKTELGTNIRVWDRNGTDAQKFKFVA